MDTRNKPVRFLVVTPNVVVGEDLKEALIEYSEADVELRTDFNAEWGIGYQLAIFGVRLATLLGDHRVRNLQSEGAQIIVLNGEFPKSVLGGTGILPLSQPFSTEDIKSLLHQIGLLLVRKN